MIAHGTNKRYMVRYILVLMIWLGTLFASAQSGNYFLSHFSPADDKLDNVCFQMVQTKQGLMYFATRSGILEFDGRNWNLIKGSGAIYALAGTENGELYWGGATGFGKVINNENALPEIKTLSQGVKNIFQTIRVPGKLYFINEEKIFILENEKTSTIPATELTGSFQSIFELFGSVFISTSKSGIYRIQEDKLIRSELAFPEGEDVLFSSGNKDYHLMGFTNNKLYVISKNFRIRELVTEDADYINKSVLVNGHWVNDNLIVIGTLRGGMVFVHSATGKTEEIINYATGLPDNEIFALVKDNSNNIWAAHDYGFTRIAPYLPFRSFNHYPGLQGNLLCAISFKNNVYVGTSLGLFRLEREDVFEEVTYFVDVPVRSFLQKKSTQPEKETSTTAEPESKRKGFFSFLRKNKNDKKEEEVTNTQAPRTEVKKKASPRTRRTKKTQKVLRTSRYAYKKVTGIDAKITQLLEVNNKLIAAGLGGTYQVVGTHASHLSDEPARYIYNTKQNVLLISTYSDNVSALRHKDNEWKTSGMLKNLHDQITYIFEGDNRELWLCALDKVYRLTYDGDEVNDIQVIEISNPNYDEVVGVQWKGETILSNAQGFFSYKNDINGFDKIDSLSEHNLTNYFAHNNAMWYRDIHGWKLFGLNTAHQNLGFLNLFQNLRYISPDGNSGNLWVITGNNELFRFYSDRVTPYNDGFPIMMKSFVNAGLKSGGLSQFNVDQENSSVTVEIVQPDYLASMAIEYRYKLQGLDETWTTWSNVNNVINFPYLPAGDYKLEVQSRDILGRSKDMQEISIAVIPPYWKRPWFYALEVLVFAFFVLLSFRLSARYRIVSRLLMLLTIIMLIQFIETIVGETFETRTSPVIDFIIQVIIAMLVLPVEGYLREMMLRSLEKNHRLKRFLTQRQETQITENIEEQ